MTNRSRDSVRLLGQIVVPFTTPPPATAKVTVMGNSERALLNDIRFKSGSYSSFRVDINPLDIAYRADTKAEFYGDALFVAELGSVFVTGPIGKVIRGGLGVVSEVL